MTFVEDSLVNKIVEFGTLVGKQLPTRESKFMYYAVYRYDNKVYAIIFDSDDEDISGEEISEKEISSYLGVDF